MRSKQEMLDQIEERSMGWSWDARVPALLTALSAMEDLPREMEQQMDILTAMLPKADYYGILRTSLLNLTSNEIIVQVRNPGQTQNLSLERNDSPGGQVFGEGKAQAIEKIVSEISRLEKEMTGAKLDYGRLLRFLRGVR